MQREAQRNDAKCHRESRAGTPFGPPQAPFLHPGEKCGGLDTQELRGAFPSFNLPVGRFQCLQEIVTFEALKFDFHEEVGLHQTAVVGSVRQLDPA